jgi:hypothetical protein
MLKYNIGLSHFYKVVTAFFHFVFHYVETELTEVADAPTAPQYKLLIVSCLGEGWILHSVLITYFLKCVEDLSPSFAATS